ncbi:MAG: nucleotide exchange factor GrpE [Bdellovibrionales bacterium]|nr:nucleotide exchange factor GrpE [Bdellovibrionales bacterium]
MTDAMDANNGDENQENFDEVSLESNSIQDPAADRDADFTGLADTVELGRLQKALEEKEKEALDFKDKYLRALADFENFKKRSIKERSDIMKYQGERVVCDLLPVLDNLELALAHGDGDAESLKTGVEMIAKIFSEALDRWDIKPVDVLGKPFDPTMQNAISTMPSQDAAPGTVIQVLKKAYTYKDKLIREGEVVVAGQASPGAQQEDE